MKRWTYKFHLTKMLEQEKTQNKENASLCPQEIRDWVAQLTLLKGVSLSCLVGDERQLPPESIRFFTVDKNWTNQLINGSFAVGAVSEKAETFNRLLSSGLQKTAQQDIYRPRQKRIHPNQRQFCKQSSNGSTDTTLTGFLLRSRLVGLWRGLESTALDAQGNPLDILRMEQLSAEILICIYQGKINRLVIREPAEGLRFGAQGDERTIRVRDIQEGKEGKPIPQKELHIGANALGKADILGLAQALKKQLNTNTLTSAELAMELIVAPGLGEFTTKEGKQNEPAATHHTLSDRNLCDKQ